MKNHVKFVNEEYPMYGGSRMHERMCLPSFCKVLMVTTVSFFITFIIVSFSALKVHAAEYSVKNVNELSVYFKGFDEGDKVNAIYQWTGRQIKPLVEVRDANGNTVSSKKYVSISYGKNVEVGMGTITITGLGDVGNGSVISWYGSKTFEFFIGKADNPYSNIILGDQNGILELGNFCGKYKIDDFASDLYVDYVPDEVNKSLKNIKVSTSNKKVVTVGKWKKGKNKGKIYVKDAGAGIAYLTYSGPETQHYKSFENKTKIVLYPPDTDSYRFSNGKTLNPKIMKSNKKAVIKYAPLTYTGNGSKTDYKCRVIMATNKNFKKSSIIANYTIGSKKAFEKGKVKTIKTNKLRKGGYLYIKTYTFKKLSTGETLYGTTFIERYKINKKGKLVEAKYKDGSNFKTLDPYIK